MRCADDVIEVVMLLAITYTCRDAREERDSVR